jgi:hypothetical protein
VLAQDVAQWAAPFSIGLKRIDFTDAIARAFEQPMQALVAGRFRSVIHGQARVRDIAFRPSLVSRSLEIADGTEAWQLMSDRTYESAVAAVGHRSR